MNEIINYEQAKQIIATSIQDIACSFVKIGYYLKYIREKELFKEDGYESIWEFAADQYGISRSTASRYIEISNRFSQNGNSPVLAAAYQDYSKSKLQEMLYLTDEQIENVTPEMTVKEIREMRKPDLEKILKKPNEYERQCIDSFAKYLIKARHDWFIKDFTKRVMDVISAEKQLKEYMSPNKLTWYFKNKDEDICHINLFEDYIQIWNGSVCLGDYEWLYLTLSIKSMWNVISDHPGCEIRQEVVDEPKNKENEPATCEKGCNVRCGWLEECATSHEEIMPIAEIEGQVKISDYEGIVPEGMTIICKEYEAEDVTPQSVLEEATKQLNEWLSAFEGEELPPFVRKQKIIVEALNKTVIAEPKQPEFPILKNNEQRKQWLNNYKKWGLWHEDCNIGARYYKYDFENGARLIAETYNIINNYETCYFHLVGGPEPPRTKYGCGKWTRHETYNRHADNITELVEFLKVVQKEKS